MSKILVTHANPDIDGIVSIWLFKRFVPGWDKAELQFVTAGKTFRGAPADDDSDVVHVDTGLGKFDHHQYNRVTCSSKIITEYIIKNHEISKENTDALIGLAEVVTDVDNARDVLWDDPLNTKYDFMFQNFHYNLTFKDENRNEDRVNFSLSIIDAIFQTIKNKNRAQEEMANGTKFNTKWGKAIALESGGNQVLTVGEKLGYSLVAKKNSGDGRLVIYARPDREVDLTPVYDQFVSADPGASWYLHPSKILLLNGSRTDPDMVPTTLTLKEIVKIIKSIS